MLGFHWLKCVPILDFKNITENWWRLVPLTYPHMNHHTGSQQFYLPDSSCFQALLSWGMSVHQCHTLEPSWLEWSSDTRTLPCHLLLHTDGWDVYTEMGHHRGLQTQKQVARWFSKKTQVHNYLKNFNSTFFFGNSKKTKTTRTIIIMGAWSLTIK